MEILNVLLVRWDIIAQMGTIENNVLQDTIAQKVQKNKPSVRRGIIAQMGTIEKNVLQDTIVQQVQKNKPSVQQVQSARMFKWANQQNVNLGHINQTQDNDHV